MDEAVKGVVKHSGSYVGFHHRFEDMFVEREAVVGGVAKDGGEGMRVGIFHALPNRTVKCS